MINRGDIKLAIDMVVNALDDNLFGGEAEYVINTLEDCGNTIATQVAVIEFQKDALKTCEEVIDIVWVSHHANRCDDALEHAREALSIPTDSTQILDEVRRAERRRVAEFVEKQRNETPMTGIECAAAIRAME